MSLPKKSEILAYWVKDGRLEREHGIWLDWGEPSCWACDFGWEGRYDIVRPKDTLEEIFQLWDRAPLQRCHIVPGSLGGNDRPENLVLLCAECHDLAPDVTDPKMIFKWMRAQSCWKRRTLKLKQAVEDFGLGELDENSLDEFFAPLRSREFRLWSRTRVGFHRQQLPPYGMKFSAATTVAALLMYHGEHHSRYAEVGLLGNEYPPPSTIAFQAADTGQPS